MSIRRIQNIFFVLGVLLFTAGCEDEIEKLKLNEQERDRVLFLQNPFGSKLVRLNGEEEGKVVLIGMQHCKVYRAEPKQGVITQWTQLSELDEFNLLPTGCNRERLEFDGEYVTVDYCKTLIGAGGGCGGGIHPHRSKNGTDWEMQVGANKWKPLIDERK